MKLIYIHNIYKMNYNKLVRLYANTAAENINGVYSCYLDAKPLANVNAVALKSCSFRNNVYNVIDFSLNVSVFEGVSNVVGDVVIPDGQYDITQFLAILKTNSDTLISGLPGTSTIAYTLNPVTYKIDYVLSGDATSIQFIGTNDIVGLTETTTLSLSGSFQSMPDLGGLTHVTISLKSKSPFTLLNKTSTEALYTNSLGVIPVNVPFGLMQTFLQPDLDSAALQYSHPNNLEDIQFVVRDPVGNVLTQQKDLCVELMIWYEN